MPRVVGPAPANIERLDASPPAKYGISTSSFSRTAARSATRKSSKAVNSLTSVPHRLAGAPVDAVWDLSLSGVMQAHGVAIAEEALAASLIPDLLR
jgi:Protein of unknown function C-terminus (DUF2399)